MICERYGKMGKKRIKSLTKLIIQISIYSQEILVMLSMNNLTC